MVEGRSTREFVNLEEIPSDYDFMLGNGTSTLPFFPLTKTLGPCPNHLTGKVTSPTEVGKAKLLPALQ